MSYFVYSLLSSPASLIVMTGSEGGMGIKGVASFV